MYSNTGLFASTYVHVVVHVLSLIAVLNGFSSPQDLWSPGALKE